MGSHTVGHDLSDLAAAAAIVMVVNKTKICSLEVNILVLEKDKKQVKSTFNTMSSNDKGHKEKQIRVRGWVLTFQLGDQGMSL